MARVGERAVVGGGARPEEPREAGQLAVGRLVAGDDLAGQPGGVEHPMAGPLVPGDRAGGLEERHVERRVVGHQHGARGAAGELEEGRQRRAEPRGARHRGVGDAGEHRDERRDRHTRVDQRLELAEHLTGAHLDRADLGDLARLRRAAGGLEVDHHEGHVVQRGAELVEARLYGDAIGESSHMSRR